MKDEKEERLLRIITARLTLDKRGEVPSQAEVDDVYRRVQRTLAQPTILERIKRFFKRLFERRR